MKYKAGDKFIIEVAEAIKSEKGNLYRANFSTLVFDDYGLDKLQKCEEETITLDEFSYNKGLNDAWGLSKRVWTNTDRENREMFGTLVVKDIFSFTPQEALAKLKAYEEAQNKVVVGDIVECESKIFAVSFIKGTTVSGMDSRGKFHCYGIDKCKKTGKHIDITSILEQIRSE